MSSDPQVFLVGAGPGDARLITVRGADALRRADVVIYDGLVNKRLLEYAPAHAELVYGGRFDRNHSLPQAELNALLIHRARAGRRVVRLKGGDCYIFGRGGEEAECLARAGIPFEIIPGVSSAQAAPGFAGIPLTHREHNSSFTVVSGHAAPSSPANKLDWSLLARAQGTLAILMGLKNLREIAATLIQRGKPPGTLAAVISRGSTPQQKSVAGSLSNIADLSDKGRLSAPAVVVIGSVVGLRAQLNWFEHRPLFGQRLVVTQRLDLARPLLQRLEELGSDALHVPATRWGPLPDQNSRNTQSIQNAAAFDWILFSHPTAVDNFFERFLAIHGDLRALGRARLGAYGPETGEQLRRWHVHPEAVAEDRKIPNPDQQLADVVLRLRNQFLDRQIAVSIQRASQPETSEADRTELLRQQQELRQQKRAPLK